MKRKWVRINSENGAEAFWQGMGGYLWASFAGVEDHSMAPDEMRLTERQIAKLKACPGWEEPDESGRALHPLIID